ncbi:hypothetical protein A3780_15225 [Kosakonia radicincitans]|uniref:hypothetical protein n=1 Tax=Kosakonia radicincitans TaxID=283686 RepID=UPI0009044F73|nr:hypothetical protein [Kosakonia radicincitans]APG18848.1 hypothetical protein A3780_15225 [Kosakonia radicincitans]
MAITAEDYLKIVQALIAKGMPEDVAHATVAAELQKQNNAPNEAPPLRDQYGRFNNKAAQEYFSHANKVELAKKYFDPLDGVGSIDTLSKKEQMDIITGRNKQERTPQPLRNVQDAINWFKQQRSGTSSE